LLGPIVVCPAGHDELEHAALAASVATGQQRRPIWTSPGGQVGAQAPVGIRRTSFGVVVSKPTPEYTGFEDCLYTVNIANDPQILEKEFFSKLDHYAALVLARLKNPGPRLVILGRQGLDDTQRSD